MVGERLFIRTPLRLRMVIHHRIKPQMSILVRIITLYNSVYQEFANLAASATRSFSGLTPV